MRLIDRQELKEIQLAILKDVAIFCERSNISYFLAYGSALGAVRHHGYIPWDDDIDIMMPRPDYNRFLQEFNKRDSTYYVYSFPKDSNYQLPFAKVSNINTQMRELMYNEDVYGVSIDLFPIDGMNSIYQVIEIKWLNRFLNTKKALLGRSRSFLKNIIVSLGKIVLWPISVKFILKRIVSISMSSPYEKSDLVNVLCSTTSEKEIFDRNVFCSFVYMDFEDSSFRVPKDYDQYLKQCYGDYMEFPPEDKRQSSHSFIAWWKEE